MHPFTFASTFLNIQLKYIANRTGDTGNPYETPVSTPASAYWYPSMASSTLQSHMIDSVHQIRSTSASIFSTVCRKQFLLIWLNTSLTSISNMPASFPSAKAPCTQLKTLVMTFMELLSLLDLMWTSWSTWFILYHSASMLATPFSHTFSRQLRRLITW